jgi:hypothetical protein
MSESDKQRLKELLKRKQKADSLPEDERKQWQKQYDDICNEIAVLKNRLALNNWDESKALNLVIDTDREICTGYIWDKNTDIILRENPELMQKIIQVGKGIDEAFKLKSMDAVKDAVERYKQICIKVNQICNDPNAQLGFRTLLDDEPGFKENPFK